MEERGCIKNNLGNFVKPYRVKSRSASEKAKSRGTSKNRPTLMFLVSTTAFLCGGVMENYDDFALYIKRQTKKCLLCGEYYKETGIAKNPTIDNDGRIFI